MIANSKPTEVEVKPKEIEVKPKEEDKLKEEIKPKEVEIKPIKKTKIIKKIVYQEASSSDSDDANEVEVAKVKNNPKIK